MVYIPGRNSAVSVARFLALAIALSVASATASTQPAGISLQLAYEVEWGNVDVATATADCAKNRTPNPRTEPVQTAKTTAEAI